MQNLPVLPSLLLLLSLCCGNPALAQTDATLAEGQRKAADGDIQGALAIYEGLTKSQPDSHDAFAHLGGMQLLDQRYADAVKSFQRAISLGESEPRSFIGMGMAYLHMGRFGAARAAFVEAKSRRAGNSDDIDDIIAWIDSRNPGAPPPPPRYARRRCPFHGLSPVSTSGDATPRSERLTDPDKVCRSSADHSLIK
jgi:tetratricopeptide (TPR) repeat protein